MTQISKIAILWWLLSKAFWQSRQYKSRPHTLVTKAATNMKCPLLVNIILFEIVFVFRKHEKLAHKKKTLFSHLKSL